MTNQELYDEIKELRVEIKQHREDDLKYRAKLAKEFYLIKGKAIGFMTLLSVVFAMVSKYVMKGM